jgi:hypothetical protein
MTGPALHPAALPAILAKLDRIETKLDAALDEAHAACTSATEKFCAKEKARPVVDHEALARRREAALRLSPFDDGRRDPMNPAT